MKTGGRFALDPRLFLVLPSLFWAGNFLVGRALRDDISPIALNAWRWGLALLLLLPFARELRRDLPKLRRSWPLLLALGATGVAGFHVFVYLALRATTALNAVIYVSLAPLAIVAVSRVVDGMRLKPLQGVGLTVSLAGAVVVAARGDWAALRAFEVHAGDAWMLLAVPSSLFT